MLKQEKKEKIKKKLKNAFFFWFHFDPLSFHHFKKSQKKTQTNTTLKIKYFKKFSFYSILRLLNNNQQIKQKEFFLLKQFLTNLDIEKNSTRHLDFYKVKEFIKTEAFSSTKKKQESKYLQSLCCLEDFLNV